MLKKNQIVKLLCVDCSDEGFLGLKMVGNVYEGRVTVVRGARVHVKIKALPNVIVFEQVGDLLKSNEHGFTVDLRVVEVN